MRFIFNTPYTELAKNHPRYTSHIHDVWLVRARTNLELRQGRGGTPGTRSTLVTIVIEVTGKYREPGSTLPRIYNIRSRAK